MRIDIHAHVNGPARLWEHFREVTGQPPGHRPAPIELSDEEILASLTDQLEIANNDGTDVQFIAAQPWAVPTAFSRASTVMYVTQAVNNFVARCVGLFPDRLAGIATLPQVAGKSPSDCLEELDRCVNDLGFVGVKFDSDPGGGTGDSPHLGDEWWYPLYERMCARSVPGLLHGGMPNYGRESELSYSPAEVTIGGWALVRSPKVFANFPDLRIVLAHGGGYLPYQFGRARGFRKADQARTPGLEGLDVSISRLYFDTALYSAEAIELLARAVGPDRLLFGTDGPTTGERIDPMTGHAFDDVGWFLSQCSLLSEEDRHAIFELNAWRLFPRFADTPAATAARTAVEGGRSK